MIETDLNYVKFYSGGVMVRAYKILSYTMRPSGVSIVTVTGELIIWSGDFMLMKVSE